jgi:tetratricopeptide (TPR) repeat protein
VPDLVERVAPRARSLCWLGGVCVVLALTAVTWKQASYWRDSETLYRHATRVIPGNAEAHAALGRELLLQGRIDEAVRECDAAKASPFSGAGTAAPSVDLLNADILTLQGRNPEAIAAYRAALAHFSGHHMAANNLAWLLATTSHDPRDAREAVQLAESACAATQHRMPEMLDTLGAAYAAAGRFDDAARAAEQGIYWARAENKTALAAELTARLAAYRAGKRSPDAQTPAN